MEPDLTPRHEHELPDIDGREHPIEPPRLSAGPAERGQRGLRRRLQLSVGLVLLMLAVFLAALIVLGIDLATRQTRVDTSTQLTQAQVDQLAARLEERSQFRTAASCASLAADVDFVHQFLSVRLTPEQRRAVQQALDTKIRLRQAQNCESPTTIPAPRTGARP